MKTSEKAFETIVVERPEPRIARIVMNRPEARNAQNLQMTYDLNTAFDQAVQDDDVKVIILAGSGPQFSSGHDLRPGGKNTAGVDFPPAEIGAALPNPTPMAASPASRKSICRSRGAGAIWRSPRLRKCMASVSPAD